MSSKKFISAIITILFMCSVIIISAPVQAASLELDETIIFNLGDAYVMTDFYWDESYGRFLMVWDGNMMELYVDDSNGIDWTRSFTSSTGNNILRGWSESNYIVNANTMEIDLSAGGEWPLDSEQQEPSALTKADNITNKLYKYDISQNYALVSSYTAGGSSVVAVVWDGTNLWSADTDKIYKYNTDMTVNTRYDLPMSISGLTMRDNQLWAISLSESKIYSFTIPEPEPYCGDGIANQDIEECDGTDGISGEQTCSSNCLIIEPEPVLTPIIVASTRVGGGPQVRVFNAQTKALVSQFFAYETSFRGGVNIAVADLGTDGTSEIVTAPGPGREPLVKIFSSTGAFINSFYAYDSNFRGGVSVAIGDFDGDGYGEIVTAPESQGGPNIRVFGYRDGSFVPVVENFMAYDSNFRGGVSVAAGDIEGDGIDELIISPLSHGGPHIRVFGIRSGRFNALTPGIMVYDEAFRGGINIAIGDINGNGRDEIITGTNSKGGPHLRIISLNTSNKKIELSSPGFFAYNSGDHNGVNVGVVDVENDGTKEIIAAPRSSNSPIVKIFSASGALRDSFYGFAVNYFGGVNVAGGWY